MILDLGDKKIRLELLSIAELKPHEETVGHFSDDLVARIMKEGIQRDPVIVDEKSLVVLDGMHRLQGLRKIGARFVVANLLDYSSGEVKLSRWLRVVRSPSPAFFNSLLADLDMKKDPSSKSDTSQSVRVWYHGEMFSSTSTSFAEVCASMKRFDSSVTAAGGRVEFMDEETFHLSTDEMDVAVLLTPVLQKNQVIHAGTSGALLPPKSTMHVFPLRPVGVDYPIKDLSTDGGDLAQVLGHRRTKRIEPPAFHGGRLYREELLVLEP
ncbi:MAG: ParB N-terminal domain-containing protein [Thaumarchaeota archaeon]|nr:ParB N-terminal domain-containing protein [Nitrososphaerota archaeon]